MSVTLRNEILKGLDTGNDLLVWIPILKQFAEQTNETSMPPEFDEIGGTALSTVAMGAVEQYAKLSKLNAGTIESLRYQSLKGFMSAQVEAAFWSGQANVMHKLADERPDLVPLLNNFHVERSIRTRNFRKAVASNSLFVLNEIKGQQERKGISGRAKIGSWLTTSPEQSLLNLIDSEILAFCTNILPVIDRNDPIKIRAGIRPTVMDYVARGILHDKGANYKDCTDTHAKRVARKLDKQIGPK